MARKHKMEEVLKALAKKHDCKVVGNVIQVLNGESLEAKYQLTNDLGNGTWGKIDFLVNHCGFRQMYVVDFKNENLWN